MKTIMRVTRVARFAKVGVWVCVLASASAGCGLLADKLSDQLEVDFSQDLIKPTDIGATKVEDLSQTVSMSPTSPSFKLPEGADTSTWSAVLSADLDRREAGQAPLFAVTAATFELVGDPVQLSVRIFSRDGLIDGQDSDFVPADVAACTFTLTPGEATGLEYSTSLTTCITEWVDTNGVPNEFDMEVTGTAVARRDRADLTYTVTVTQTMHANEAVSTGRNAKILKGISSDILDNIDNIKFENLKLAGVGWCDTDVSLEAKVTVWDASGKVRARGKLSQPIAGGTRYWINAEMKTPPDGMETFTLAGTARPTLSPTMPGFIEEVLRAAATAPKGGDATARQPVGVARWTVVGGWPREGTVAVEFEGIGKPGLVD